MLEEQQHALIDQDLDDKKALDEFEELAYDANVPATNEGGLHQDTTTIDNKSMHNNNEDMEKDKNKEAILRPEAIFLHGLDEMSTKDIRTYCNDLPPLEKIEWINDTSCKHLVSPPLFLFSLSLSFS